MDVLSVETATEGLLANKEDAVSQLSQAIYRLSGSELQERILQLPNPREVVQGLPLNDFFWIIKKIGPDDSMPLLELASNEQWEHLLDLEIWRKDRIALDETGSWLKRLYKADRQRLARWLTEEGELLARFYLSRLLEVGVRDQETDTIPDGFFTLDDVYYLKVRDPNQQGWIQELISEVAKADYEAFVRLLLGVVERLPSDMEEELYRFRGVRLAESGFLPFEEAMAVYSPLEPDRVMDRTPEGTSVIELDEWQEDLVPVIPWEHGVPGGLLAKAVSVIQDPLLVDRLRLEFATLANRLISAEGMPVMDLEVLDWACKRAASYVSLGLERLTHGDPWRASQLLRERAMLFIFRVGFGMALRLQWEAKAWVKRSWFKRMGLGNGFWGETWGGMLSGILRRRPLYFVGEKDAEQFRDFRRMVELEEAARILARLQVLDELLEVLEGHHPLDSALLEHPEATFLPLLFNLWGRYVLGLEPKMVPLTSDQVREMFGALRKGDRRRPYRMPEFEERFVEYFLRHVSEASRGLLRQTLSVVWREFTKEYERVPLEELDRRFLRFLHVTS